VSGSRVKNRLGTWKGIAVGMPRARPTTAAISMVRERRQLVGRQQTF